MDKDNLISKLAGIISGLVTVSGLLYQFFNNSQITAFLQFSNPNYLKAFSSGNVLFGLILILILYKYRFILSNKIYFDSKLGQAFINQQAQIYKSNANETLNAQNQTNNPQDVKSDNFKKEPLYFTLERTGWVTFLLLVFSFIGIIVVNYDLVKGILYFLTILGLTYTSTIFVLHFFNDQERKQLEKNSLDFIKRKIEEYLLPEIKYTGQMKTYTDIPAVRRIWFESLGKKYVATVNMFDPDLEFAIMEINNDIQKSK